MKNGKYILAILICFLLPSVNSHAQQLERKVALSAYIYNFAKNILWQNEDAIKEFHFLVVGQDDGVVQEMKKLSSRKLRNKSIKVLSASRLKDFSNVNLIFLLNGKDEELARVFDLVEGKNILLVSDNYKDERVMMINFYDTENGTLRFKINKPNIINQHLRIMDDMILLGGTEIDVANLYHEAQQSLRELQKHSDLLEGNLAQLEKTIAEKNKEVQISKDSLLSQTLRIQSQQNVLLNQGVLLKQRESELLFQDEHILKQQQLSTLQTQRLNKLSKNLDEGSRLYEKQKKDILHQRSEIDAQARILKNQGQTINRQRYVVFSLFTLIVMVAVIVFSILRNYKVKKKLAIELENRVMERTNDLNLLNEQLKVELAERKLAEESLRMSEERYRYLFEQNPANMLIYDYQTLQLLASQRKLL